MTNHGKIREGVSPRRWRCPNPTYPLWCTARARQWDSVGHMTLVAALEDAFDIMIDMDDIIDLSSFEKGKEILKKYDVEL